jgi:ribosome maturation factor RimP
VDLLSRITQIIEPSLEAMGYGLVLVKFMDGKTKTLSIMAERADEVMMSFDDCADISRTVSALLDVEDPIQSAYNLEVMSPGIDRPLTRASDYTRFAGFEAKLETMVPVDGRKRFKGVVEGISPDDVVTLVMPEGKAQIALRSIRTAKLVVTDELIDMHLRKQPPAKPQSKTKKANA